MGWLVCLCQMWLDSLYAQLSSVLGFQVLLAGSLLNVLRALTGAPVSLPCRSQPPPSFLCFALAAQRSRAGPRRARPDPPDATSPPPTAVGTAAAGAGGAQGPRDRSPGGSQRGRQGGEAAARSETAGRVKGGGVEFRKEVGAVVRDKQILSLLSGAALLLERQEPSAARLLELVTDIQV